MMRNLLILLCILVDVFVNSNAYSRCSEKPKVIAVIDSGFGFQGRGIGAKLCKFGHKDFTSNHESITSGYGTIDPIPLDTHGHGTNIVGIIVDNAKDANYCVVVIKYYEPNGSSNIQATINSIRYAISIKADYINYSSGGTQPSSEEREVVNKFIDQGGTFVTAAGNNSADLDIFPNSWYPAMYDKRIVVVGALGADGARMPASNYGSVVNRWELGLHITAYGLMMSGTSQATATATGKIVRERSTNKCDIGNR